jgi:hypothetical protein
MEANEPLAALPALDSTEPLLHMLNGHCLQQALHVVAVLGVADRLAAGPKAVERLAASTATDRLSLLRLMRALASVGVFEENPDGVFALTPLGAHLRTDAPGSVRDRALYYGSPAIWGVWGALLHSIRTGEAACAHVHGEGFYGRLLHHPEVGRPFNGYLGSTSERHTEALLRAYDFSGIGTLVDVGGGLGGTICAILARYPAMRGVVYDIPGVAEQGTTVLAARRV